MAICIGCGRHVPGLDEGDFCRMCGGDVDQFDYEREPESEEPEDDAA